MHLACLPECLLCLLPYEITPLSNDGDREAGRQAGRQAGVPEVYEACGAGGWRGSTPQSSPLSSLVPFLRHDL